MARTALPLTLAALLTLYLLLRIPTLGRQDNFGPLFLAWALACLLYALAFVRSWRLRWRVSQRALAALGLITLLGAGLRLWDLGGIPYNFGGDEAEFARWSLGTTNGTITNPFATGWLAHPTLGMFFEGLALRLLGPTVAGARLTWALLGVVTIPAIFWLGSQIRGTAAGLAAAALLATYHLHIHYSRIALNNIGDPLFLTLALCFLLAAIRRRSLLAWAFCGMSCGLALYFYQGARLVPLVVGAAVALIFLRGASGLRRRIGAGGLLAALGGLLVVGAPLLQLAILNPTDFNARVNTISILRPGWLDATMARTGLNAWQIIWDQFRHAALAFNLYPDASQFYNLPAPLLDPLFGLLMLVGLAYAMLAVLERRRSWRLAPLVLWWWGAVIAGGMLTDSPPSSQRLLTLSVPVCLFIVLALDLLLRAARQIRPSWRLAPLLPAAVLLFAAISGKTYFVDYSPRHLYGGTVDTIANALAGELHGLEPGAHVYFGGEPLMFWDYSTLGYLLPGLQGEDVHPALKEAPPADWLAQGQQGAFVFLPERLHELELVRQTFPGGEQRTVRDPVTGAALVEIYTARR